MRKLATLVALGLCTLALPAFAITVQDFDSDQTPQTGDGGPRTNDCPGGIVYDNGMFDEYTPPSGCSTAFSAGCFVQAPLPDGLPADWRKIATTFSTGGETLTHAKIWSRYNASGFDSGLRVRGFCIKIYEAADPIVCPDGVSPDPIGTLVYDNYANTFTEMQVMTGLSRQFNYCITLPSAFPTVAGRNYWFSASADYDLVDWNGLGQANTQWFWRMYPGQGFAACEASAEFCDDASLPCDPWTPVNLFGIPCWLGWEASLVLYGVPGVHEGACCFEDGSCVVTGASVCNGTYQGDNTVCDPNPCPQPPPSGACCLNLDCFVLTQADCEGLGGIYMGDGRPCDPNPCGTATRSTTWGSMKNSFGK